MGYESKVACRIELPRGLNLKILGERYIATLKEFDALNDYSLEQLFDEVCEEEDGVITLVASWGKWYESYPEIQAFDKVLTYVEEYIDNMDEAEGGYHLMRIGEEYDDVEERTYGDMQSFIGLERDFSI